MPLMVVVVLLWRLLERLCPLQLWRLVLRLRL